MVNYYINYNGTLKVGWSSAARIITRYGLNRPGKKSWCDMIFRPRPYPSWGLPSLLYDGCLVSPEGTTHKNRIDQHFPCTAMRDFLSDMIL